MFISLIIVHVIFCFVLMIVILLQAGRGGGLTEAIGGDGVQSVLGTQAPAVLKKATTISAIGFLCTSLLLGMVTANRGKSIFERSKMPNVPVTQQQIDEAVKQAQQQKAGNEALKTSVPEAVTPVEATAAVPVEGTTPVEVADASTQSAAQTVAKAAPQDEPQSERQAETLAEVTETASETPY